MLTPKQMIAIIISQLRNADGNSHYIQNINH